MYYNDPNFYDVNDVQNVLRCKESKAYRVIRECNKELQALGFIIHPGKVSAEYFLTQHGLTKEGIVQWQAFTKFSESAA